MQISLEAITLHNFGSFQGTSSFMMPAGAGLCGIWGENRLDPKLGSNGAGKSTLWEALRYLLYGRDSRGRPATTLTNWWVDKDPMWVEATLTIDGVKQVLRRSSDRTSVLSWKLGNTKAEQLLDQESVEARLGWSGNLFENAVLHSQRFDHFLDMKPGEKLAFVSELTHSKNWDAYAKQALEKKNSTEKKVGEIKDKLNYLRGKVETLTAELNNAYIEKDDWASNLEREEAALDARIIVLEKSLQGLSIPTDSSETREALLSKVDKLKEAIEAATIEFDSLREGIAQLDKQMASKQGSHGSLELDKKRIRNLRDKDYECPLCGNKVDREHLDAEWRRLLSIQRKNRDEYNALRDEWEEKSSEVLALQKLREKAKDKLNSVRASLRKLDEEESARERDRDKLRATLEGLSEQRKSLHARKTRNPWEDRVGTLTENVSALNKEVQELKQQRDSLTSVQAIYEWWSSTFKEVKLYLIQRVVKQLEINVNNALSTLGMEGYRIEFAVERETKSGSLSQKFHTLVHSPHVDMPVPWESWSGGEEQRLKLATGYGIVDAITSLTGIRWNIEVWDEPSAHLSETGVQDLLALMEHRARTSKKQVWTIDHRSLGDAAFLSYVGIVKDDKGVSHIQSVA